MPGRPVPPAPPNALEGFQVGALVRECGVLSVHAGASRLDLPVEVYLVSCAALSAGFEVDDFLANVRRAAAVHHEALLPFVTGGREGEFAFAVAKSAEGRGLDEVIARDGPLSDAAALDLAATVAGALEALERAGMRHGDLAPRRVVLASTGVFLVRPPRLVPASLAPREDGWQAPEEARGGESGVASDLFVLGLILVWALTGASPLAGSADPRRALRDWKVPDLAAGLPGRSPELRAVVAKLLAAEPANRHATAAQAHAAIDEARRGGPAAAPVSGVAPPPLRAAEAQRRPSGRLVVATRLGGTTLEIDDDVIFLGPGPNETVRWQKDPFDGATLRIERAPATDVVQAVKEDVKVNGSATRATPLAEGDDIVAGGVTATYERTVRAPARPSTSARPAAPAAPPPPKGSGLAAAVSALAVLATVGVAAAAAVVVVGANDRTAEAKNLAARAEQSAADDRRRFVPPASAAREPEKTSPELAARDAYETAATWIRTHRSDKRGARERSWDVFRSHPETAYGLLARWDVLESDRRTQAAAADHSTDDLLLAAEAHPDEAMLSKLRAWAEDHSGTLAGERAHVALVKLQAVQTARFDADMAALRAAEAKKDWRDAKAIIARIKDYVPVYMRDALLAEEAKVQAAMNETYKESGAGAAPPTPGKKPTAGEPRSDAEERNKKAEEVFRAAREAARAGKDMEALEGFLTFLHDFKDTVPGVRYERDARTQVDTLVGGPAGVARLFRGRAEQIDKKGRWRLTYDFADARQFTDFRDLNAFERPPRAAWKWDDGAVRAGQGSGALVLDAVFRPDELMVSVSVTPGRPHDLGVAFVDPTEQRRFFLFTLQNTFFTLGKGADAKPFLENAIVLFGPGMWNDTPPDQLGFVRKAKSDDPQVHPDETLPLKCGKSGDEVWMRFEGGREARGSAQGDKPYDWSHGMMPALFVLGSSGSFDQVVVEGTPDPDWVRARWAAILEHL